MELVLGIMMISLVSGAFGLIALMLILEHIEKTGKKPWED